MNGSEDGHVNNIRRAKTPRWIQACMHFRFPASIDPFTSENPTENSASSVTCTAQYSTQLQPNVDCQSVKFLDCKAFLDLHNNNDWMKICHTLFHFPEDEKTCCNIHSSFILMKMKPFSFIVLLCTENVIECCLMMCHLPISLAFGKHSYHSDFLNNMDQIILSHGSPVNRM